MKMEFSQFFRLTTLLKIKKLIYLFQSAKPQTSILSRDLFIDKKYEQIDFEDDEKATNDVKSRCKSAISSASRLYSPRHRQHSATSSIIPHLLNTKAPIVYATKPRWLQGPLCVDDISEIRDAVSSYYETSEQRRREESRRLQGEWKRVSSPRRLSPIRSPPTAVNGNKNKSSLKRISSAQASFYAALQCYLPGAKTSLDLKNMSTGIKTIKFAD